MGNGTDKEDSVGSRLGVPDDGTPILNPTDASWDKPVMNTVTLARAQADATEYLHLFEDEYRLLVVLLLAKADVNQLDE